MLRLEQTDQRGTPNPCAVRAPRFAWQPVIGAEARGVDAETVRESYLGQTSLHSFIDARDIAGMVLFICSDAGAKISVQALAVDAHTESLSNR